MQLVNIMFLGECVVGGGKVEYMNERELPLDLTMNN